MEFLISPYGEDAYGRQHGPADYHLDQILSHSQGSRINRAARERNRWLEMDVQSEGHRLTMGETMTEQCRPRL